MFRSRLLVTESRNLIKVLVLDLLRCEVDSYRTSTDGTKIGELKLLPANFLVGPAPLIAKRRRLVAKPPSALPTNRFELVREFLLRSELGISFERTLLDRRLSPN